MEQALESSDSGFLDIATNTLAIVMIVMMFSLLTVRIHSHASDDPDAVIDPPIEFRFLKTEIFKPFADYYFVFDERLVAWQQDLYVQTLAEAGPKQGTVALAQGRLRLQGSKSRDADNFKITFLPDFDQLKESNPAWNSEATAAWIEDLIQRYENERIAPTFLVFASGMPLFSKLYPHLKESGLVFRWYPWQDKKPVRISRQVSDFTSFRFRW